MKTLYDLLGVHADANTEQLRKSFREAAKANHPDLHAGDPAAAARFRRIVEAYAVLRNAEQRAMYDRMLELERRPKPLHSSPRPLHSEPRPLHSRLRPLHSKLKHAVSGLRRRIISDAIATVGLAIVMVGAYTLFKHMTATPIEKAVAITAMAPAETAAVPPVQTGAAVRDGLDGRFERVMFEAAASPIPDVTTTAPDAVVLAAHDSGASEIVSGHAGPRPVADHSGTSDGIEPPDQARTKAAEVSARAKPDSEPKPSLSNLSISNNKRDVRIPNTYANDTKLSETKIPGRPQIATKRQAAGHAPLEQASLENKSASGCTGSQSCSGGIAPLFGVGF